MMEKMGWHEGEGLGKESLGRAEPVSDDHPINSQKYDIIHVLKIAKNEV